MDHTEHGEVCDGCGKLLICRNCGKFRSAAPAPQSEVRSGEALDLPNCDEIAKFIMRYPYFTGVEATAIANAIITKFKLSSGVSQAPIGPREVLDALADKVAAKIGQLEHYKANDCQLDHARTIAEGRISQANQILHWIAEAAVSHSPSVPSASRGTEA